MCAIPRHHRYRYLSRKQSHHSDARICFHHEIRWPIRCIPTWPHLEKCNSWRWHLVHRTRSIAGVYWEFVGNPYGIMSIIFGSIVSLIVFVAVVFIERSMGKPPAPPAIPDYLKE